MHTLEKRRNQFAGHCAQTRENLTERRHVHIGTLGNTAKHMMTAKNIRTHSLERWKVFECFFSLWKFSRQAKVWLSLKIAAIQGLLATTKRADSLCTDLHCSFASLSRARFFGLLFSLQRVENKLRCASWCDAPFIGHRTFSLFAPPMRSGLPSHCMDRSAQRQPTLSALQLANVFMLHKTKL